MHEKGDDRPAIGRRAVLGGMAALAASAVLPLPRALAEVPNDQLLAASSRITGIELDGSYIEIARQIWAPLAAKREEIFEKLIRVAAAAKDDVALKEALDAAGLRQEAEALAFAWYTGMVDAKRAAGKTWSDELEKKKKLEVVTYDDALTWQACTFTKPPVSCGGDFGYWENQPENEADRVKGDKS